LLVASTAVADIITLSANNEGEEANNISIRVIENNTGITLTLSSFTGGAGAVTFPDIESLIGNTRYQGIVVPGSYDINSIKIFIDDRYNVANEILDGVVCISETDTASNLEALALTINSQSIILNGNKLVSNTDHKGGSIVEYNPSLSSMFMAYRALKHSDGADISQYKVGNTINNKFGGVNQVSSPDHNAPFNKISVISKNVGWSSVEQIQLNNGGVFFFGNNTAKSSIVLGDVVSTYLTNAQGLSDETFHYLNAIDIASSIREFLVDNNKSQYTQSTLTSGDLVSKNMANAGSIRAYNIGLYSLLSSGNYVLTQA
jgi:phage tail sheath gpL-like